MSCGAPCDPEGRRVERVALYAVPQPERDWAKRAACRGLGPDVFFASDSTAAKVVCDSCTVVIECEGYAARFRIPYGTWGQTSEAERRGARRRRRVTVVA